MGEWINRLVTDNITSIIITSIIGGISWFGSKRYFQDKELKAKDLENDNSQSNVVAQNLKLYQAMLDDIERRYEDQLSKRDIRIKVLESLLERRDDDLQ